MMKSKTLVKIIISLLLVIILFAIVSIQVQANLDFLRALIKEHFFLGMFIFVFIEIISIVIAPVTSLPLIPLAANTYGIPITILLFIIGDFFGSLIAFFIGRKFKNKFLGKFVQLEEVELVEKAIPKKHYFWTLILMRIIIPADILSYTLGIMTRISYPFFIITTIIGIIPASIYFSYLGVLPIFYQLMGWAYGILILAILLVILFRRRETAKRILSLNDN